MCQVAVVPWGLSLILCQTRILEGQLKCFLLPVQELAKAHQRNRLASFPVVHHDNQDPFGLSFHREQT